MKNILKLDNIKEAQILRKKCKKVNNIDDPSVTILLQKMQSLCEQPGVAGVAANQLGSNLAIFALSTGVDKPAYFMFNPKIIEYGKDTKTEAEGCLSVPEKGGFVKRSTTVTIQWQDYKHKRYEKEFDGFWARALQHETDHLNGILYVDRCDTLYTEEEMQAKWLKDGSQITAENLIADVDDHVKGPLQELLRKE